MSVAVARVKKGREKSLARRHPWIFSGALDAVSGAPAAGETVRIETADGAFVAWAAYSPQSQIRARVWSWEEGEPIDERFIASRLARSIALRGGVREGAGARLVHAEADGLPGLVVDHYSDTAVIQCTSAGADRWRDTIADALATTPGIARIYERSDAEVRALEGLAERSGPLRGVGPTSPVAFAEGPVRYLADVVSGHKTGFYLDQQVNRAIVARHAKGARLLNCFCYTGGFGIAALAAGARQVVSIDSSADALALGREHLRLNGLPAGAADWREADVFVELRRLRDQGRQFEVIVLDPPKFAPTAAHVERAARAYKDINLLGLKLLAPGGKLATFSCSGAIDAALFQRIVAGAAEDARVDASILERLHAAPDHPETLAFPEGAYLKGLLLQKR